MSYIIARIKCWFYCLTHAKCELFARDQQGKVCLVAACSGSILPGPLKVHRLFYWKDQERDNLDKWGDTQECRELIEELFRLRSILGIGEKGIRE